MTSTILSALNFLDTILKIESVCKVKNQKEIKI